MPDIQVRLPDGSAKGLPEGSTVLDVAGAIGPRLAKAALAGKVNGELVDLDEPVRDGDEVAVVTDRSDEALGIIRHSAAHVMAEAVEQLFPGAKLGIGPSIEDGFYYDFAVERPFTPEDLERIEGRMREIVAGAKSFECCEVDRLEADRLFEGQPFKRELIDELSPGERIRVYTQDGFMDLCRGPHVPDTSHVKAFKLMKVAGAYWRGDERRPMLQRIYGTAWRSEAELADYLHRLEEAEKRDHRKLGRELDLFSFHEEAGSGLVFYHPKGARILRLLQEWEREEHYRRGYQEIVTPHVFKADVWKVSGHYDFYGENMYFFEVDEGDGRVSEYGVKPMNCPGAVLVYKEHLHSYRDLPLRLFEFGTVYRHEKSGVVHGLMRARGFTQDDAHIFCTPEQVKSEVGDVLDFIDWAMNVFGFSYEAEVSTRPREKSIGREEDWRHATEALMETLRERGTPFEVCEGEGAFYGPKIDIKLRDAIGRMWQCATVQVDFNFPERFDLTYRTADNTEERPFMLHRVIVGSQERFLGILIEHYAGAFPLWLAPVQAVVIPIADRHLEAAHAAAERLGEADVRVEVCAESEPMRVKIAKAQQRKVPYMLVIGDKEAEVGTVSVRERTAGDIGVMGIEEFAGLMPSRRV